MTNSILIVATQRGSGKSAIALGLANLLERFLGHVGYFKPVGYGSEQGTDPDVALMKQTLGLVSSVEDMAPVTMDQIRDAIGRGDYDRVSDQMLDAYNRVAADYDFVVCEGTDYAESSATLELDINADIAGSLGAPIILVASAGRCPAQLGGECHCAEACQNMLKHIVNVAESLDDKGCELFGVIINRVDSKHLEQIQSESQTILSTVGIRLLGLIPRAELLELPRLEEIVAALGAEVICGQNRLHLAARDTIVAAMGIEHALNYLDRGSLVLVPGDREDILLGMAATFHSRFAKKPSGIVITGGLEPGKNVKQLVLDLVEDQLPIMLVQANTYQTAINVRDIKPTLSSHQRQRIEVAKGLVERHIDVDDLVTKSVVGPLVSRVTPKQFMHRLVDTARRDRKHIVLPEGTDERILHAAYALRERGVADITLLGNETEVHKKISSLHLKMHDIPIVDPVNSEWREEFARRYIELRARKKTVPWDTAYDGMTDASYFGTMMVQQGYADGMVSGAEHTTAQTLRPALEFIRTREGFAIASSVFFMLLRDRVLVYGDCAVNPKPNAEQLADIALASAATSQAFEIEPRIAMLSYSTGASGQGSDVELVREAVGIIKQRDPSLLVEGPIQYDAAIDPEVAKQKLAGSRVAGNATVFIFPDLNSGNTTYKAVQRSAGAIAIGPIMQGLKKPVNDLSRGCTVPDIFNTVAITAIQAQRS